jgi:hypothetical protein
MTTEPLIAEFGPDAISSTGKVKKYPWDVSTKLVDAEKHGCQPHAACRRVATGILNATPGRLKAWA